MYVSNLSMWPGIRLVISRQRVIMELSYGNDIETDTQS
jgi:hypothetical protein